MKFLFKTPVVLTSTIHNVMKKDFDFVSWIHHCLTLHFSGDFGCIPEDEKQMNMNALEQEERIFSVYEKDEFKIFVITDAGHEITTVLFSNEY